MFSRRRSYALQIIFKFERNSQSKLAKELIDMIIWGSKNLSQKDRLEVIDCVIFAADGIVHNSTAAQRLKRELQISDIELAEIRYQLNNAVLDFAMDHGRTRAFATITETNRLRNQAKET
jgi:hypothetical protein